MSVVSTWRKLLAVLAPYQLEDLADLTLLQRAASVSLLGVADAAVSRSVCMRPSRYEHAVGVVTLFHEFGQGSGLDVESLRHGIAAALLHDLGHYPLSHSVEPVFAQHFGVGHHEALTRALADEAGALPELRLETALNSRGLRPDRIAAMLGLGPHRDPLTPLFTGVVNVDTLDAILRVAHFAGIATPSSATSLHRTGLRWNPGTARVEADLSPPGMGAIRAFLRLKADVYAATVYAPTVVRREQAVIAATERRLRELGESAPAWHEFLLWGDVEFVDWLRPGRNGGRMQETFGDLVDESGLGSRPVSHPRKGFSTEPTETVDGWVGLADLARIFPRTTTQARLTAE